MSSGSSSVQQLPTNALPFESGLTSPSFYLVHNPSSISTMVTYTQTVTTTTTATMPTRGGKAESNSPPPDMTPGEAAGLTVGLVLLVILLVAAEAAFLTRRRTKRRISWESERGGLRKEAPGDWQQGTAINRKEPGLKRWRWPQPAEKRRQRHLKNRAENRNAFVFITATNDPGGAPPWLSLFELPGDTSFSQWDINMMHELEGSRYMSSGTSPAAAGTGSWDENHDGPLSPRRAATLKTR